MEVVYFFLNDTGVITPISNYPLTTYMDGNTPWNTSEKTL